MIRSQSSNDDSRCDTITIVRPLPSRVRLAFTKASLSGSSALVASSRISSRGSAITARAIASRCFCPPDRLADPSSIQVS